MSLNNWLINGLTMENAEEVKPGFFIQRKGTKYRRVYPLVWDKKYQIKEQLKTVFTLRTLFTIGLILFIAWSYQHDVQAYQTFYIDVRSDPIAFCAQVKDAIDVTCTEQNERSGLCTRGLEKIDNFNLGNIEVVNEDT